MLNYQKVIDGMIWHDLVGGWVSTLWKIWFGQLGWWHSQLNGTIKAMFQTTNQWFYVILSVTRCNLSNISIYVTFQMLHLWFIFSACGVHCPYYGILFRLWNLDMAMAHGEWDQYQQSYCQVHSVWAAKFKILISNIYCTKFEQTEGWIHPVVTNTESLIIASSG